MDYKEYFISKWPEEGVGYIKDNIFYPLENLAEDKKTQFKVDNSFLIDVEPDLFIHSHTTGHETVPNTHNHKEPSKADLIGQINMACEWGICVTDGEICEDPITWGNPDNRPDLIGRDFIFNIQDCFSLAQDYFYKEHKIIIPNVPRDADWIKKTDNFFEDLYQPFGFELVDMSELQEGDILFYKVRTKVVNHIGIYKGNGQVLSHWFNRLSAIEPIGMWAQYIMFCARYKGLK